MVILEHAAHLDVPRSRRGGGSPLVARKLASRTTLGSPTATEGTKSQRKDLEARLEKLTAENAGLRERTKMHAGSQDNLKKKLAAAEKLAAGKPAGADFKDKYQQLLSKSTASDETHNSTIKKLKMQIAKLDTQLTEQAQKQAQVSTTAGQEERNPASKTEQKLHDQVSL